MPQQSTILQSSCVNTTTAAQYSNSIELVALSHETTVNDGEDDDGGM